MPTEREKAIARGKHREEVLGREDRFLAEIDAALGLYIEDDERHSDARNGTHHYALH